MTRSDFIRLLGAAGMAGILDAQESPRFPAWQPGLLDIHHIATGRGSSTFLLLPDGTSMMIDAGATQDSLQVSAPPMPDSSRRPGQWMARYAARQLRSAGRNELDYLLVSHLHPDHLGDVGPDTPASSDSTYRLTGVSDVDALLPVRTLIDRGYPQYDYPARSTAPFAVNYFKYVESRRKQGKAVERFQVGAGTQMRLLRQPRDYPQFSVRNIAANGEVWTGSGETTRRHFPDSPPLPPTENMCSAAIRVSYGKFSYYTGGDLTCSTNDGEAPWRDIETPVARATGPVDVAVVNHHGYYDAAGPEFVKLLRPKVFIIPTWHISHPDTMQLERLERHSRQIYATNLTDISKLLNARLLAGLASAEGHVVVRVHPGGDPFEVMVLDHTDESDRVKMTVPFAAG